jgi:carbamoyl-phosphate synthase large subunit
VTDQDHRASTDGPPPPLRLFVRQSYTEASEREQIVIQAVIDTILESAPEGRSLDIVTGAEAQNAQTFKAAFAARTGIPFTPRAFRDHRLALLDAADAMIIIRTGLSESSAFEVAYNVMRHRIPMFFAIWQPARIKTTLLQDLEDRCTVEYHPFTAAVALRTPLLRFLDALTPSPSDAERATPQHRAPPTTVSR